MTPVGFELTVSAGERTQTYTLDRAATGTGASLGEHKHLYQYAWRNDKKLLCPKFIFPGGVTHKYQTFCGIKSLTKLDSHIICLIYFSEFVQLITYSSLFAALLCPNVQIRALFLCLHSSIFSFTCLNNNNNNNNNNTNNNNNVTAVGLSPGGSGF
jgi:hypothetical protein